MLKSLLHKTIQSLGYDVVSAKKLDAEVERRIKSRERDHINAIERIRQHRDVRTNETPTKGGVTWVSRDELVPKAAVAMKDVNVLLDVGCAFRPQKYFKANIHVCCEPFQEYMDRLIVETAGQDKFIYLQQDLEQVCSTFPDQSVDTVYMCDVIEHIDRDVAEKCLKRLTLIARQQVILFTPIGYMAQDPSEENATTDQWGMGGMEWQKHKSGWTPDDFSADSRWSVIACKDFHRVDGYFRDLENPFGAMWAIWNNKSRC